MNWLDIVIIVITGFVAITGWKTGAIHVIVSALGVMVGLTLSSRLYEDVQPLFSWLNLGDNLAQIVAFSAILLVVLIASLVISRFVRAIPRQFMMGWVDNALGLTLGVVVNMAVLSSLLSVLQSHPILGLETTISDSTLGSFLADKFDVVIKAVGFLPDDLGV